MKAWRLVWRLRHRKEAVVAIRGLDVVEEAGALIEQIQILPFWIEIKAERFLITYIVSYLTWALV